MAHSRSTSRIGANVGQRGVLSKRHGWLSGKIAIYCAMTFFAFAVHANDSTQTTSSAKVGKRDTLAAVLQRLSEQRGVDFSFAPDLANDVMQLTDAQLKGDLITTMFDGYNYATKRDSQGTVTKIVIIGRSRTKDTLSAANASAPALANAQTPERFRNLPPDSVSTLALALDELFGVPVGGKTSVNLPTGEYHVVHDSNFEQSDDEKIWIGYLEGQGTDYRMVVKLNKDGGSGQISTPEGIFRIESEGGKTWLVNLALANAND